MVDQRVTQEELDRAFADVNWILPMELKKARERIAKLEGDLRAAEAVVARAKAENQ